MTDDLVRFWELGPGHDFREAVRRHLRRALGECGAGREIACLSGWAARTVIDEIARHPLRGRLRVVAVAPARTSAAADERLRSHAAARGVALGPPSAGRDAAVIVAAGSLCASACGDPATLVQDIRRRCAPGAVVVWSHNLAWPERARRVRSRFEALFGAVDVEVVGTGPEGSQSWFVGSARPSVRETADRADTALPAGLP